MVSAEAGHNKENHDPPYHRKRMKAKGAVANPSGPLALSRSTMQKAISFSAMRECTLQWDQFRFPPGPRGIGIHPLSFSFSVSF